MNSLGLALDSFPAWFIPFYVVLFGLCVGSFLNVVILRGLSGEEFVFSRSKCPKCSNQLKWYMNIPLLSYVFLGGKCAFCKTKISFQYPLVEFITAVSFLILYLTFGLTLKFVFMCLFFSFFIIMSATDFIETVIIDTHAYILLILALLYSVLKIGNVGIIQAVIGAVFGFLIFEIMARIGKLFLGVRMFGEGDSLIALGLGAIFGWKNLLVVVGLSVLIQCFGSIPFLIKQSFATKKNLLAFSYIVVILSMILVFLANYFNFAQNNQTIYTGFMILIISGLMWSLKNILIDIRNKKDLDVENDEDRFNLMPFGPALIFASIVGIFYLQQIKNIILDFLF